jgi:UDP-galactopyranose mutase
MLADVDLLVWGGGRVGCVVAERAATLFRWKVLVVDRRPHVAGNCHDSQFTNGVLIHNYGPHYFRTNDDSLLSYLSQFTDWIPANYEVRSMVRGKQYPFPINIDTLEQYFNVKLDAASAEQLLNGKRAGIQNAADSEEMVLSRVGRELYDDFYRNYTIKQWGMEPRELEPEVCGRIPVKLNRDPRYVTHKHQVMPKAGFTAMFAKMLRKRRIRVLLDCPFESVRSLIRPRRATVYAGPVDAYFGHCFGKLPYRSLQFDFVPHRQEYVQPCVQINYPNEHEYTRSVEIKHVTGQRHPETVLSFETPKTEGEPFYPVPQAANKSLSAKYQLLAERERVDNRVYFCGRLAQYKYFNTDEVMLEALACIQRIGAECGAKPRSAASSRTRAA